MTSTLLQQICVHDITLRSTNEQSTEKIRVQKALVVERQMGSPSVLAFIPSPTTAAGREQTLAIRELA